MSKTEELSKPAYELREKWKAEQISLRSNWIGVDTFEWTLEERLPNTLRYIGGVDISFDKVDKTRAVASLVV